MSDIRCCLQTWTIPWPDLAPSLGRGPWLGYDSALWQQQLCCSAAGARQKMCKNKPIDKHNATFISCCKGVANNHTIDTLLQNAAKQKCNASNFMTFFLVSGSWSGLLHSQNTNFWHDNTLRPHHLLHASPILNLEYFWDNVLVTRWHVTLCSISQWMGSMSQCHCRNKNV